MLGLGFTATNKILLARFVGLTGVSYYELAALIASQIFLLALTMAQALYPALAAACVEGGMEALRTLYLQTQRLAVAVILPIAAVVVSLAGPLIAAWLGRPVPEAVWAVQALALGWTVVSLMAGANFGLQAIGHPGWAMLLSLYHLVSNLILALILVPAQGFFGLLIANVLALTSSALLTLALFKLGTGVRLRAWLGTFSPALLLWTLAPALGLAWWGTQLVRPQLWMVVLLGGGYVLLYGSGVAAWLLRHGVESAQLRLWLRRRLALELPS